MSNPLHPNIDTHVLQIVPYTFSEVLTENYLLKRASFSW